MIKNFQKKNVQETSFLAQEIISDSCQAQGPRVVFEFDRRWFNAMWLLISIALLGLISRLFFVSVLSHDTYAYSAHGNTHREKPIIAPRGRIYANDGQLLADNEPNYVLIYSPRDLAGTTPQNKSQSPEFADLAYIAQTFDIPVELIDISLREAIKSGKDTVIKDKVESDQNIAYKSGNKQIPGFTIRQNASRIYPQGELFAHIIGYEGLIKKKDYEQKVNDGYLLTDRIGKTGIEFQYEDTLRGHHGLSKSIVDSRERIVRSLQDQVATPGKNLHTHIDKDLQIFITNRLRLELTRAKTPTGAAVALDPRTGAVKALVSLPLYDNNAFVHGIDSQTYSKWITDQNRPLFNRAVAGTFPPGSTVKPVMGVATVMEKVVAPSYQIESKGGVMLGNRFFGDWKAHGFTDLRRAIAVSSDVYFYTVAGGHGGISGMGIERMNHWMTRFGYGQKTGIDLPSEVAGTYPTPKIKQELVGEKWYAGDTYNAAIGQGFVNSTPLQVANSIAAVANGGTLYTPTIANYFQGADGEKTVIEPVIRNKNLSSPQSIKIVQEAMRQTVTEGTAQMMQSIPVEVAGKTGTAQFGTQEKVHSWFVAYAPYDDPELVLLILTQGQAGEVSSTTMPVARDVLQWYFDGRSNDSPYLSHQETQAQKSQQEDQE